MANLIRNAKSGSKWSGLDLNSYHISINQMDPLTFFGLEELPQPSVDEELLTTADASLMQHDDHAELITLLDLALIPSNLDKGEAAVCDFTVELFKALGYVCRQRVARTRVDTSYLIASKVRHAKADICIQVVDYSESYNYDILLVIQADKRSGQVRDLTSTQAQLVVEAIVAFDRNNRERQPLISRIRPLAEKVMPGIIMDGTLPIFFKIPVTEALVAHICHGTYPPEETHVTYCYPPSPRPAHQSIEGMKPLDNRHEIFKCFEAFKSIVGI